MTHYIILGRVACDGIQTASVLQRKVMSLEMSVSIARFNQNSLSVSPDRCNLVSVSPDRLGVVPTYSQVKLTLYPRFKKLMRTWSELRLSCVSFETIAVAKAAEPKP